MGLLHSPSRSHGKDTDRTLPGCICASVVSPPVSCNVPQEVSTGDDAPDFGEGNTNRKSHTLVKITVKSPRIRDTPPGR